MTVAGRTIASASAHRDNSRDTVTQNARSMGRSRGRGVARQRIASCWRSKRFSATKLARGRKAAKNAPTIASTSASMVPTFAPAGRPCQPRIGDADGVSSSTAMFGSLARTSRQVSISPGHLRPRPDGLRLRVSGPLLSPYPARGSPRGMQPVMVRSAAAPTLSRTSRKTRPESHQAGSRWTRTTRNRRSTK
jgi:hypothetical protein